MFSLFIFSLLFVILLILWLFSLFVDHWFILLGYIEFLFNQSFNSVIAIDTDQFFIWLVLNYGFI